LTVTFLTVKEFTVKNLP